MRREARIGFYVACTLTALAANYFMGKEMAWDTLSYHFYDGFSAVHDRFAQDYFAAGPQSYFNPYAYAPFYCLVGFGLPALAVGSLLAVLHSVILWLTFELAVTVCPSADQGTRLAFGACAAAMALINPVLLQQLGSSFSDITTGELALGGWLLMASAIRSPTPVRILCAGLLMGAATALKPTNAVHAVSCATALMFLKTTWARRARLSAGYGLAGALGLAVVAAPWSFRLERYFGNPFFPLLNGLFRSPEFTTEPLRHFRFTPTGLASALWRPFAMIDPSRMVHVELSSPDPRYALLLIFAAFWLASRMRPGRLPAGTDVPSNEADRTLAALGCGLALDWVLWLYGSGNSRYFLPASSVAAVVLVALIFRLSASRPKVRNYLLLAIFSTQAIQIGMGAELRWNQRPWGGSWFNVAVPEKLMKEPNLYLTVGAATNSFVAPFLAEGSGLVNFSGGFALMRESANGQRVDALIRRYAPHLRVLVAGSQLYEDQDHRFPRRSNLDDLLERFDLRVDPADCATITVIGLPPEPEITFETSVPAEPQRRENTPLLTCGLTAGGADHAAALARRRPVDLVFDRLEDACPQLFQPRRPGTEYESGVYRRQYFNTDITAWVSYGTVKFRDPSRGDRLVSLGRESDWLKAPLHLECGRHGATYFAKVQ